jgi:biotin carboxylase
VKVTNLRYPLEWKANTKNFLTGAAPDALEIIKAQTSALTRTKIDKHCCICGECEGIAMHHVRHVRRNGKDSNKGFDKVMGKINRTQIPVCSSCHSKIHNGRYDGMSLTEFADAHLAAR